MIFWVIAAACNTPYPLASLSVQSQRSVPFFAACSYIVGTEVRYTLMFVCICEHLWVSVGIMCV